MCELDIETLKQELDNVPYEKGLYAVLEVLGKVFDGNFGNFDYGECFFGTIYLSNAKDIIFPSHYLLAYNYQLQLEDYDPAEWWENILYYQQALFCATSSLKDIQNELEKDLDNIEVAGILDSTKYLLINPREEVVNWALENKENICLRTHNWTEFESFIRIHQSNPVLCDKILNTLKKDLE